MRDIISQYMMSPFGSYSTELFDLAVEHEEYCESFDRSVCTCRDRRGTAMPRDGRERVIIERNAKRKMNECIGKAESMGYNKDEFREVLKEVQRKEMWKWN